MRNKSFYSVALSFCFIFFLTIFTSLDGRWTGTIVTPDGNELSVAYNFKTDGEILTGTAESPAGLTSIDNGKVSGDKFTFDVTVSGNVYPHKGVLYTDSCSIDIDFGGGTMVHTIVMRDKSN